MDAYPLSDIKLIYLVNNESSEIIRIFNSAFNEFLDEKYAKQDFYPTDLKKDIDEVNEWIYHLFNNGVYKVPFNPKSKQLNLVRLRFRSIRLYSPSFLPLSL